MEITKELVKKGFVKLAATDVREWRMIHAYNQIAREYARRMKQVRELRFGFYVVNPLMWLAICLCYRDTIFAQPFGAVMILVIQCVTLFVAYYYKHFWLHTLATVLLLTFHWLFAVLLATNALLLFLMVTKERPLKKELGYPDFEPIEIITVDTGPDGRNDRRYDGP